jgi:hypothetical protein
MFKIMLFNTVSAVLKCERILLKLTIPHKLIPVPKAISSDCGICVRFEKGDEEKILEAIKEHVVHQRIEELTSSGHC